ncbi:MULTISPECIES: DUF2269 family protein [Pseudomonas]|jgi:uncharacterized membrane protein|uniref:DUF2269 family protein n=1 Tax=Pseudomonas TaxID=286 RepID=UPI00081130E0|nr:DUF2269 family protein [Pseudomonas defluvii]MBP9961125.1 DUF2269 family protein [Pseudomonas sp.]MEE3633307.1 DUF2269 family protein [Pseudomonas sp. AL 58]
METLSVMKMLHGLATALSLGCALGLVFQAWRQRANTVAGPATSLQRPWLFVWILMGLSLFSLPFSGWWLVHLIGWPLEQAWLLGGAVLYLLGCVCWLLLVGRLGKATASRRSVVILAALSAVIFLSIIGLMVAKPV